MSEEQQLRLQAFLDGELPESDAREVLAWTQRDADAAALLTELRNTRAAIAKSELHLSVPETREFYWSKIEREIQKLEPVEKEIAAPILNWRRLLWPLGTAAICFVVAMMEIPRVNIVQPVAVVSQDTDETVVETDQANSDATTYRDEADGTTLVWFSAAADANPISGKMPGAIN